MATEYARLGDLSRYAQNELHEFEMKEIAEHVLQGLTDMHSQHCTRRDIKPQVRASTFAIVKLMTAEYMGIPKANRIPSLVSEDRRFWSE